MTSGDLEDRAQNRLGTVLRGKYRLESVLGVGGMAVVYKATHRNQAEYAVKMLHAELSYDADLRTRFLREGHAANSVKHPGVVRVVDDDVSEDGAAFLVMELLDGLPGDRLLAQHGGRLPLDAACLIAVDLLEVLAAAHAKAIIHRDIKPANLFITRDGSLKVLDFGIARVKDTMTGGALATGTGMQLGTPAFMAPEQAIGRSHDVDARADLWAVGATVLMLATGSMVHEAETAPQLLVKLATQPARSLATLLPDAPAAIVTVIDRALALDKAQRWSTASAMRDALVAARRASFGDSPPRAVLSSLVASSPVGAGSATAGGARHTARPSPVGTASAPGAFAHPTLTAGRMETPRARGAVVETPPPVSASRSAPRRRSTSGVVLALVAFGALAMIAAVAWSLRGPHVMPASSIAPANSTGPAEAIDASSTMRAEVTSGAIDSARPGSSDVAGQDAQAQVTSEARPSGNDAGSGHAAASPRPKPSQAAPTPHVAEGPPPTKADAPPPPAPRPPAPPVASPVDPLDGRR